MRKIFFILLLTLAVVPSYAQDRGLSLTIKTDKTTYKSGEQIKVEYVFKNTGNKDLRLCVYDLKHQLMENTVFARSDNPPAGVEVITRMRLKDWTKRKMPVVQENDFRLLRTIGEYKIEIAFDTMMIQTIANPWRYINVVQSDYRFGEGEFGLPSGIYKIQCGYANDLDCFVVPVGGGLKLTPDIAKQVENAWMGKIESNLASISLGFLIDESAALEIARKAAKKEGIRLEQYPDVSVVKIVIGWQVWFKMKPQPPGGDFMVNVDDRTGETHFMRGE
jgi:hypothetical protein